MAEGRRSWRSPRWPRRATAVLASTLIIACGDGGEDRSGAEPESEPVVLTMAQPNFAPSEQLILWADEVERQSGSTVKIEFEDSWREGEVDYEAGTVEDVAKGDADLGWIGSRGFDQVGVTSFQALGAPLVVDSYDLQEAVFAAGIPDEMLAGLDEAEVRGVAVLPGPHRRVLGLEQPFTAPGDFGGAVVGIQASEVAERTFTALGATSVALASGAALSGVDAYEQQVASVAGNAYWEVADHVTTNVNLWPRPFVVFANEEVFDALSAEQQEALTSADEAVLEDAMAATRSEDDAYIDLCDNGMTLVEATDAELDQLRSALAPVVAALAEDAETASFLDAIDELKRERNDPPDTLQCPEGEPTDDALPQRTFERTLHRIEERDRSGCDVEPPHDVIHYRLVIGDGTGTIYVTYPDQPEVLGGRFDYEVFRDRITIIDPAAPAREMSARFTFDGTNLVFSDLQNAPSCADEVIMASGPWALVEE
jgi:TRAP-type C4-dicarboxylate transport system substrate-binding protein